jgi:hypothetical protein
MIKNVSEFVLDAAGWGLASVLAALASFGVGIWEHIHDKTVPSYVFLCLSVPLFWAGSYIAWTKKKQALDDEMSLHGGPEISFSWGAAPPLNTRKALFIENSGTVDAYEVRVGDIGLDKAHCGARFRSIAKCSRGSVHQLSFELYGDTVLPQRERDNLEMVVYASQSDFQVDNAGNTVVEFPITVTFEEYGGARYEANFRFVADDHLSRVSIHRINRQRVRRTTVESALGVNTHGHPLG